MKQTLKRMLAHFGYQLSRINPGASSEPNPLHLWDADPAFNPLYAEVTPRTLVDKVRCFVLYQLAQQAAHLPGGVAEIGVYRGGTARLLSKTLAAGQKPIHLFDTFSGMPPPTAIRICTV